MKISKLFGISLVLMAVSGVSFAGGAKSFALQKFSSPKAMLKKLSSGLYPIQEFQKNMGKDVSGDCYALAQLEVMIDNNIGSWKKPDPNNLGKHNAYNQLKNNVGGDFTEYCLADQIQPANKGNPAYGRDIVENFIDSLDWLSD